MRPGKSKIFMLPVFRLGVTFLFAPYAVGIHIHYEGNREASQSLPTDVLCFVTKIGVSLIHDISSDETYAKGMNLIMPKCRILASVNWVSIGPGSGASPVGRQAIAATNTVLSSTVSLESNFDEI